MLRNHHDKSAYIHTLLIKLFKQFLIEDYTMLLGIDSFLYLNESTLPEYFEKNNISGDISEIYFRWQENCKYNYISEYNLFSSLALPL